MGAVDWNRRLFDSLIPLPDGTSYNAYLVEGSLATALIDSADPTMSDVLMRQLEDVQRVDFVVANHAEQDHSGTIPRVMDRFPGAKLVTTPKGRDMLVDLLMVPGDRIVAVEDGATISLGDRTLRFVHTPWVHWPETMVTYLEEDRVLFSCDFFGSHLGHRRGPRVRGGEAVLRRDNDALPEDHPEEHREGEGAGHRAHRALPRADLR